MIRKHCTLKLKDAVEKNRNYGTKTHIHEGDLWPPYWRKGARPVRINELLRNWNNAEFTLASAGVFYLVKSPSSAH